MISSFNLKSKMVRRACCSPLPAFPVEQISCKFQPPRPSSAFLPSDQDSFPLLSFSTVNLVDLWTRCWNFFRQSSRTFSRDLCRSLPNLSSNTSEEKYTKDTGTPNRSASALDLPDLVLSHCPVIPLEQLCNEHEWAKIGRRLRIMAIKFEKSRWLTNDFNSFFTKKRSKC